MVRGRLVQTLSTWLFLFGLMIGAEVAACGSAYADQVIKTEDAILLTGPLRKGEAGRLGGLVSEVYCLNEEKTGPLGSVLLDFDRFPVVSQNETRQFLLSKRAAPSDLVLQGRLRFAYKSEEVVAIFVKMYGPGENLACGRLFHANSGGMQVAPLDRAFAKLPVYVEAAKQKFEQECILDSPPEIKTSSDGTLCQAYRFTSEGGVNEDWPYWKYAAQSKTLGFTVCVAEECFRIVTVGNTYFIWRKQA